MDSSDTILAQIHSGLLENCYFHVFAICSKSLMVQLHQIKQTLFADHSD